MRFFVFGLFIFSLFLFAGCKKDVEIPTTRSFPDTIYYHNIIPDTTFTSTGSSTIGGMFPSDGSINYPLDVDGDMITDFNLFSTNHLWTPTPTSHLVDYNCGIASVNVYDGAACSSITGPFATARIYSFGDIIDNSIVSNNSPHIYGEMHQAGYFCGGDFTDKYIGFKIYRYGKNYFGWILFSNTANELTIKSWAINKTANNSIKAGQLF